jgi:predicted negative regulator of RcsB-dependent stress response
MFEMLNEEHPDAEARRTFWKKVGYFVVALAVLGGVIYFFAFLPYSHSIR